MRCQPSSALFLGLHIADVFAVLPAQRPTLYLSVQKWCCEKYKPALCLAVPKAPYFAYCPVSLHGRSSNHVLGNVYIKEHCALTFCSFHENCKNLFLSGIRDDP